MTTPAKFDAFRKQLTDAFTTFMERPRPFLDRLTLPRLTRAQKKQRACLILETTEVSANITAHLPGSGPVQIYHLDWTHLRTLPAPERLALVRSMKIPEALTDNYTSHQLVDFYLETIESGY